MHNEDELQEYRHSIRALRDESNQAGISDSTFKKMYYDNLEELAKHSQTDSYYKSFKKMVPTIIASCVLALLVFYNFSALYSCLVCSFQEYIYPGLRSLRKLTIPLISLFPSLTDLYQETCLVQNPFFTIVDMDCWPCSMVNNVGQVYDPQPITEKQHNAPFIYKTEQPEITINALKEVYDKNVLIFHEENSKVLVDNQYYKPLSNIFEQSDNLFVWKLNSINEARIIRELIPRPVVVPKFGQSIERFMVIDTKLNSFRIPDSECNYSFLLAVSGDRIINLKPAEECKHQCKSFKVDLKESYLLWYNWWYWRPTAMSSSSNKTFVAHVGSYC
ncbi:uncharacterized protein LOC121728892 [Aricia agestis]|uniref:uncharacterized protein LOC121728892 n=1 Tax=Aricia agestis TaxID=91739 RepID=UPI001C2099E5|nr:uncharacterized protein LOC121728892 [Aricia agestis]